MKNNICILLISFLIVLACSGQNKNVIVYSSEKSGYFEIYTHDLGTNTSTQLTKLNSDMPDYAPSFSIDGKIITFNSYRSKGWRSWIMNSDGSNKRMANQYVTYNGWTRLSPDNTKMAFQSYRPSQQIYVADAEGKNPTLLVKSPKFKFCATPSWSHDGKFVIFAGDFNGVLSIYKFNIQSKELTKLTNRDEHAIFPSFSPNDKKIVFTSLTNGLPQIFTIDSNGNNIKQLTANSIKSKFYDSRNKNDLVSSTYAIVASWSPDGTKIVYSKMLKNDVIELFIMDSTGKDIRQVTFDESVATFPSWTQN